MRWEQRSQSRWFGYLNGQLVGFVGLTVTEGGEDRYWFAWLRDGSPEGVTVGQFDTAQAAMTAVDDSSTGL